MDIGVIRAYHDCGIRSLGNGSGELIAEDDGTTSRLLFCGYLHMCSIVDAWWGTELQVAPMLMDRRYVRKHASRLVNRWLSSRGVAMTVQHLYHAYSTALRASSGIRVLPEDIEVRYLQYQTYIAEDPENHITVVPSYILSPVPIISQGYTTGLTRLENDYYGQNA